MISCVIKASQNFPTTYRRSWLNEQNKLLEKYKKKKTQLKMKQNEIKNEKVGEEKSNLREKIQWEITLQRDSDSDSNS